MKRGLIIGIILITSLFVMANSVFAQQTFSPDTYEYVKDFAPDGSSFTRCIVSEGSEECFNIEVPEGRKYTQCNILLDDIEYLSGVDHLASQTYSLNRCRRENIDRVYGFHGLCANIERGLIEGGISWEIVYQGETIESGVCQEKVDCAITLNGRQIAIKEDSTIDECSTFFNEQEETFIECGSMSVGPGGLVGVLEVTHGERVAFRSLCPDELTLPKWILDFMRGLFGYE